MTVLGFLLAFACGAIAMLLFLAFLAATGGHANEYGFHAPLKPIGPPKESVGIPKRLYVDRDRVARGFEGIVVESQENVTGTCYKTYTREVRWGNNRFVQSDDRHAAPALWIETTDMLRLSRD